MQAPEFPASPVVAISGPAVIGPCASLPLDLSGSTGGAGRDWAAASFAVAVSSGPGSAANVTKCLNRTYGTAFSSRIVVPSEELTPGTGYTFSVALTNFLGVTGIASVGVSVLEAGSAVLPTTSIQGQPVRDVARSTQVKMTCTAFVEDCGGKRSSSLL